MKNKSLQSLVLVLFFLSGASALMYQVVWMRLLTLTFGTTTQATAIVLAAFMAGLALGSQVLGRYVDRRLDRRISPLRLYLWLEIGIAVFGALSPLLFSLAETVYAPLVSIFADVPWVFTLLRFLLLFVVIAFGAALMGGTLPVLAAWWIQGSEDAGRKSGLLYGVNTAGAVMGVFVCGFFIIPFFGVTAALITAVALNGLIAVMVLLSARPIRKEAAEWSRKRQNQASARETASLPAVVPLTVVLLAFGLSGFAALGYEVVWTRVLAQIIGSSVYAFAIMLLTFLFGLMAGSLLMSRYLPRVRGRELAWFALFQLLIAAVVWLLIPLIGQLPRGFLLLVGVLPQNFSSLQLIQILMALPVMLLPTLLLGALFPLACQLYIGYRTGSRIGTDVGRLYAVNTWGAVLGAVVTGFVLLPWLGSELALRSLAGVNAVIGLGLLLLLPSRTLRTAAIALVFASATASLLAPPWNALLMNSNVPNLLRIIAEKPALLDQYLASEVIYTAEDASASVLVYRIPDGSLHLNVNGHAEGGTHRADMSVQVELAVIPALLHRKPEKVLLVGLGPGFTLAALEQMADVKQIDVVEISAAVVKANDVFAELNNRALEDPRVNLIVDDARHFLQHSDGRYDLVIIGPSYAWVSGTANLFTAEFYTLVKQHLHPDGLMAVWFQLYNMVPDSIKIFAATVNEVFPHTSLWLSGSFAEIITLASVSPHSIDYPLVRQRIKQFGQLAGVDAGGNVLSRFMPVNVNAVIEHYLMGGPALEAYTRGARINRDNRPLLEFEAPRHVYDWDLMENLQTLFAVGVVPVPIENLSQVIGQSVLYPFIGLKHGRAFGTASTEISTRHAFSAAAVPKRYLVSQAIFSLPGYQLELRVTAPGHNPGEEELIRLLRQTSGLAQAVVNRTGKQQYNQSESRDWYWLARQQQGRRHYYLTWYCPENGFHYLGRLDATSAALSDVELPWAEFQRRLICYNPGRLLKDL